MEPEGYLDLPAPARADIAPDEMDWNAYAEHYDRMCELNPAYQENLSALAARLPAWQLPAEAEVLDLGAGTGNYIALLSRHLPTANFTHIDIDAKMNRLARHKYHSAGISQVDIIQQHAQRLRFPENSFDLIVCVNALYAIPPQDLMLRKIHRWLKPQGRFFAIDFGRKQRVLDWAFYLLRESLKNQQAGTYLKALIEGREVIKQNRRSTKGQESGRYWTHSTADFGSLLAECGFHVDELALCYRGYSDLAVCSKWAQPPRQLNGQAHSKR